MMNLRVLLVIAWLAVCSSQVDVRYVKPHDMFMDCQYRPCLTLDQYAEQPSVYFSPGSTLVFLPGNHSVEATVNISSTANITLKAEGNDSRVNILSASEVTIFCDRVTNLVLYGLNFILDPTTITTKGISALHLFNCWSTLISHTTFQGGGNTMKLARGVYSLFSELTILSCRFEGNTGDYGGAIYASAGSILTLDGDTVIGNTAKYTGGAIYLEDSTITLKERLGNAFLNNSGRLSGGALNIKNSEVNFEASSPPLPDISPAELTETKPTPGVQYFGNNTGEYGGAVYCFDSRVYLKGTSVVLRHNSAHQGGGMFLYSTGNGVAGRTVISADTKHLYFAGNKAGESGGAVYAMRSYFTLRNTSKNNHHYFIDNTAGARGGAIYSENGWTDLAGTNDFAGNNCSSVEVFDGFLSLSGKVNFIKNTAIFGGGIALYSSEATVSGSSFTFRENSAINGGGIFSAASKLNVTAHRVRFINNKAQNKGGGIAVRNTITNQPVKVMSASFFGNRAKEGGALHIESCKNVEFESTIVNSNLETAALRIIDSNVTFSSGTEISNNTFGGMHLSNSEVLFTSHTFFETNSAMNGGAVNSLYGKAVFNGVTLFTQNTAERNGGAFYAIGTDITFMGIVNITHSSAQNGGAMYFKTLSSLTLSEPVTFTTAYNNASLLGGAIFNEDISIPSQCDFETNTNAMIIALPLCFLKVKGLVDLKSTAPVFIASQYDTASRGGNFLYGGLLDRCQINPTDFENQILSILAYRFLVDKALTITSENNSTRSITSEAYQLCFCEDSHTLCTQSKQVTAHRGQSFTISVLATAQGGDPTATVAIAKTQPTARLRLNQSTQHVHEHCTDLVYNVFSTQNNEELVLYPDGPCRDTGLARAFVNVTIRPCPDGFVQAGEVCVCEERFRDYELTCTIDEDVSIARLPSRTWLSGLYEGSSYRGSVLSRNCPVHYCKLGHISILLNNSDVLCDHDRSGVLCGECQADYSLVLGSSHCRRCSNAYLALLLPFAITGIALVVFLSLLRLTVATGMIGGIIFYANIIQANRNTFLPTGSANILTMFISWLNLDLGFETCFYDGMTAFAQSWLQFVFPLYLWALIGIIILASRRSLLVSRLIGHNPVAVLATLLLMSYAKILKIVVEVFLFTTLDYPESDKVAVWLKDANVPYLKSWHLLLVIVTSLVFVFLFLPYTFLLLAGYKLYHFSDRKWCHWLNRIMPLLDSYYAPYKKNSRFWTGFLLLARCIIYTVFSLNSLKVMSVTLIFMLVAMITAAWVFGGIYTRKHLDFIESSILLNLLVLSTTTAVGLNSPGLVYFLIGIVLVTTIGIIAYRFHVTLTGKLVRCLKRGYHKVVRLLQKWRSSRCSDAQVTVEQEDPVKQVSVSYIELCDKQLV